MSPEHGSDHRPTREAFLCGVTQVLPPALVLDALTAAPVDGGDIDVMTGLRCELQQHHTGPHFAIVRLLYAFRPDAVWTRWTDGHDPETVLVLPDCPRDTGTPPDPDDHCTLFLHHPGRCSFTLTDPERQRLLHDHPHQQRLFHPPPIGVSDPMPGSNGCQERPIELPMLPTPQTPTPTAGCTLCTLLDTWRTTHNNPDHPEHNPSRAIDCGIEIRNHPHTPPKMTLPTSTPDPK
ncbi:hypothetical protein [Streptomyces sp. NPDC020965]|uniref:hypothetical protein n=1 Tax=Streptomyces sp. NPDC020965 TaxID=3365105 RepID=UPI0037A2DE40